MAILALSLAALALLPLATPCTRPTSYGQVQGGVSNGVEFYRGIPFATPPVGDLRWKAPLPPKPWTGVFNATSYGNECIQGSLFAPGGGGPGGFPGGPGAPGVGPGGPGGSTVPQSEDCLYLNVYVQQGVSNAPVMVWIHGGGFTTGSGSDSSWDGTVWLPQLPSRVVLVTINYRLNVFGFLGSQELQAEGSLNAGLLDQQLALQWVRDNIHNFGGNPNRVTAFGESAGAVSLGCHLLYKGGAQSLFDQAILESGSYPSLFTLDLHSVATAQTNFDYVAQQLQCSGGDVLQCLGGKNTSQVSAAVPPSPSYGKLTFSPILADPFFSHLPADAVRAGRFSGVPMIAGTNGDEGRLFLMMSASVLNDTAFVDFIASYLPLLTPADRAKTYELYNPLKLFPSFSRAASQIIGDTKFVCNSEYLTLSKAKTKQAAFRYLFNFTIGGQQAAHGDELSYVFPAAGSGLSVKNDYFLNAWPYFAYHGRPTKRSSSWPTYSDHKQLVLVSNNTRLVQRTSNVQSVRCKFWRKLEAKYYLALTS